METELSKKYLVKEVPYRPAQTERGLQWFKTSFQLPDNSTTIIPLQISIALYKRKGNRVIGEEQYQINNPTKPYIIPVQVLDN